MGYTINQLKALWNREKESYTTQEIGSGVQKFVKEVLKSQEIFNLSEGRLSTDDLIRKNEFLEEKTRKKKRADIIIFIDPDIVIPTEVEKFGSISAGVEQLYEYQRVWDKKYGLLTDGYEWIFYNNKLAIKRFKLESIFNKPHEFLEFWTEYIKPLNYYLQFFEKSGQLALLEEDISVGSKVQDFFSDITTLIRSFRNKLNIKGYFEKTGGVADEKLALATEITYAYIIQFILYKTLVDNDFEQFRDDFSVRLERIYKDLKNESYGDALSAIRAISEKISRNIYRPFRYEQEFINQTLEELLLKPINDLSDITPWLDIFVFIKRYNFANVRNEIFGYVYENYLKDLYPEEGKRGQYFTDPRVVNFMLEQIGFTTEIIKEKYQKNRNSISLIDPACGSGTFLYSAVSQIIKAFGNNSEESSKLIEDVVINNIFGLDIAEFPLYLAEMSILMRMLPLIINEKYNNIVEKKIKVFKTLDSVAEFMDTAVRNTPSDLRIDQERHAGQLSLLTTDLNLGYPSYVRDEDDLKEMKKSLENIVRIPRRRFDYVIANPPYISYNESVSQGLLTFEKIGAREIHLTDIYGVNLHSVPNRRKGYPPKPNIYAFFIALGLVLLKENGSICYIIPQTILTENNLDVIRFHLAKFTTIIKIFTFNVKMFIGRGLGQNKPVPTSSLILVVEKKNPLKDHYVDIIHYNNSEDDIETCLDNIRNGKKIIRNRLAQKELLANIENWNFIKQKRSALRLIEAYKSNSESSDIYWSHELSLPRFKAKFYFDVGFILDKKYFSTYKTKDSYSILDFKRFKGYSRFSPNKFYPKDNSKIGLTKNSQGYVSLGQKYKIVWRIKNPEGFHFTSEQIIFNMGTASIIASDSMNEMYYLFSLLNSPITMKILRGFLSIETEKELQVAILPIKQYVRVPKITKNNRFIKNEIIRCTKKLLELDMIKLSDIVNFSDVLVQKFDKIKVAGDTLILTHNTHVIRLKIDKGSDLIAKKITEEFGEYLVDLDGEKIKLDELKNLQIVDTDKQNKLKAYIDDLVFALYFNVPIKGVGIEKSDEIRHTCSNNEFYRILKIEHRK